MHYICYKYKRPDHLLRIFGNKIDAKKGSDFFKYTDKWSVYVIVSPETKNIQHFNILPNWNLDYVDKLLFVTNENHVGFAAIPGAKRLKLLRTP